MPHIATSRLHHRAVRQTPKPRLTWQQCDRWSGCGGEGKRPVMWTGMAYIHIHIHTHTHTRIHTRMLVYINRYSVKTAGTVTLGSYKVHLSIQNLTCGRCLKKPWKCVTKNVSVEISFNNLCEHMLPLPYTDRLQVLGLPPGGSRGQQCSHRRRRSFWGITIFFLSDALSQRDDLWWIYTNIS